MSAAAKNLTRVLKIVVLAILVLALVIGAFVTYLVLDQTGDQRWINRVYEQGPWGSRSIWISEENDLWIISEEREDNDSRIRCDVAIYMKTAEGWDEISFNFVSGSRSVMVGTYEKVPDSCPPAVKVTEIFTCNLFVKNGKMTLENIIETGERAFVNGRDQIVLTQFDYETMIAQCPFPYAGK